MSARIARPTDAYHVRGSCQHGAVVAQSARRRTSQRRAPLAASFSRGSRVRYPEARSLTVLGSVAKLLQPLGSIARAKLALRFFQMTSNCLFAETQFLGNAMALRPC
jgi:hypothetical protein